MEVKTRSKILDPFQSIRFSDVKTAFMLFSYVFKDYF